MIRTASAFGLLLALAGHPLIAAASLQWSGERPTVAQSLAGQAVLWGLAVALLAAVHFWEHKPLSSVGLRRFTFRSAILGVGIAATLLYIATPLGLWLVQVLGLPGFDIGPARLRSSPMPVLACAALTAGVVEELCYRGNAIERLTELTGSRALGALLSLLAFSLAHLPFWGTTYTLFILAASALLTLGYVWQRDLAANMIGHALTAGVQLAAVAAS
jgi:uncharacterized protein